MSRLSRGRDTLMVWPEVEISDDRGSTVRVPGSAPTSVRGLMQPISSVESAQLGQQVSRTYRFMARSFPGGPWARVVWSGREFDVLGEPQVRNGSARTAHATVLLSARAPAVL